MSLQLVHLLFSDFSSTILLRWTERTIVQYQQYINTGKHQKRKSMISQPNEGSQYRVYRVVLFLFLQQIKSTKYHLAGIYFFLKYIDSLKTDLYRFFSRFDRGPCRQKALNPQQSLVSLFYLYVLFLYDVGKFNKTTFLTAVYQSITILIFLFYLH